MRAFKVHFTVPGEADSTTVVVESLTEIRQAIADKNYRFSVDDDRWCKVTRADEIPFSNVRLVDLTVAELLKILGK